MNDLLLMRKNLWRKPVRTTLLLISILIAFLLFGVLASFNQAFTNFRALPNRMVTLSKVNFTEPLPMAHFERISHMDGVLAATHMNWFGGYYREPQNILPTFAIDPQSYFQVYANDLHTLPAAERDAFFRDRTSMLVAEPVARQWGWHVGQRIPLNSNIFTNKTDGSHTWAFTLVGTIPTPEGSSQTNAVLVHYDYFNETVTFGRDRVGWIPFLTTSAAVNDRVSHAIDARFANSADETSTSDEASFNKAFTDQIGPIALIVTLVVSAAFVSILLIVGTTMALAVRERTKELGVMKTLGFSSGRILRIVLGESLLLSFLGAALGMLGAVGLLALLGSRGGNVIHFATLPVLPIAALIALALGLVTGLPPALAAYRMRIVDAFATR
jgi:putative ABC transport system permease protein